MKPSTWSCYGHQTHTVYAAHLVLDTAYLVLLTVDNELARHLPNDSQPWTWRVYPTWLAAHGGIAHGPTRQGQAETSEQARQLAVQAAQQQYQDLLPHLATKQKAPTRRRE